MQITRNAHLLMLYVQHRIYEGLKPDANGVYTITRREFISDLGMGASTFDKNRDVLVNELMRDWDLELTFDLKGLLRENLFVDIEYSDGALRFKRNTITLRPELSYVWAIKPPYWDRRQFVWPYIPVPDNIELPIKK